MFDLVKLLFADPPYTQKEARDILEDVLKIHIIPERRISPEDITEEKTT